MVEYVKNGMNVYEVSKAENEINILYIHGLGSSGVTFAPVMNSARLARYNHYALDLAGYGKSSPGDQPKNFDDYREDIIRFVKSVNKRFLLAAHSMGGVIGIMVCEKYPDHFWGFLNEEGDITIQDCLFVQKMLKKVDNDSSGKIFEIMLKMLLSIDSGSAFAVCDPVCLRACAKELVSLCQAGTLAQRYGTLTVPSIYVAGSPNGIGDYTREELSKQDVQFVTVEDSGHFVHKDQTESFIDILEDFIKKHRV